LTKRICAAIFLGVLGFVAVVLGFAGGKTIFVDPSKVGFGSLEYDGKTIVLEEQLEIPLGRVLLARDLGLEDGDPIVDAALLKEENRQLGGIMRDAIFDSICERRGIQASPEEKAAAIEEHLQGTDYRLESEHIQSVNTLIELDLKALHLWYESPGDSAKIFKEILEPEGVTLDRWELTKAHYPNEESGKRLRVYVAEDFENLSEKNWPHLWKKLLKEKL